MTSLLLALVALPPFAAAGRAAEPAPSFWDPGRKLEKPDLSTIKQIRFLTEDDYPPFDFALPDGTIAGFNVDLARALCEELEVACTIQRRRWDLVIAALEDGGGDAAVASMAVTDEARKAVDFTAPYYTTPGRFVIRKDSLLPAATPAGLEDRTVAVAEGSAHEAFLQAFFPKARLATFPTAQQARAALKDGRVHAMFGDAISLSFWLNGQEAGDCCQFKGGPFTDPRFFGDGVGIAVKRNNVALRRALDYALARIAQKGVYSELYLKYFPIGPY
ncbi:transporter substrate-binding domain-containing protein [Methylosinus sp. Sm6]|uniref:transporter substrate-binding domain-containing protein n=1 Tax=Methylosinus sp. Sm6 TaxID=2866948 RepID=UPI002102DB93|nr:transporter substrate-binding domain-containing protein [Methylosinus sp. Sm6]